VPKEVRALNRERKHEREEIKESRGAREGGREGGRERLRECGWGRYLISCSLWRDTVLLGSDMALLRRDRALLWRNMASFAEIKGSFAEVQCSFTEASSAVWGRNLLDEFQPAFLLCVCVCFVCVFGYESVVGGDIYFVCV